LARARLKSSLAMRKSRRQSRCSNVCRQPKNNRAGRRTREAEGEIRSGPPKVNATSGPVKSWFCLTFL
jgi:hypothetical protein